MPGLFLCRWRRLSLAQPKKYTTAISMMMDANADRTSFRKKGENRNRSVQDNLSAIAAP